MARGDMLVKTRSIGGEIEVLNRKEYESVPMTIDFSSVSDKADNGLKVVKAGTPVNKNGVPVKSTPWTGACGVILHDVYEDAPQVAILTEGYLHVGRVKQNTNITLDAVLITELNKYGCRVRLEEPITP